MLTLKRRKIAIVSLFLYWLASGTKSDCHPARVLHPAKVINLLMQEFEKKSN